MKVKLIGFLLVLFGIAVMIIHFGWAPFNSFLTWPFLLFIAGAILLFFAILYKNGPLIIWGGIIATLGITIWGIKYVKGWPDHWSILVALIGLTILIHYAIIKSQTSVLVGTILFLIGLFAYPGIRDLPLVSPITSILHSIWPVLIIILGFIFLIKK